MPLRVPIAAGQTDPHPEPAQGRLGTFEFISWWEREKVQNAKVMVVGAGALGNEVIKNLALMGIGHLFIVDFDKVEAANLSRSVLFREGDNNRSKAEIAAARAKSINPDVHVQYMNGDVTSQLGLGIIRRMDVVIGCLDNREARLAVNRFCYWVNKPWVDGAIQELLGLMRVFVPGQGACYECTLTEQALRDLSARYSCPLLARQNILLGKVPTTPTIASIIGGMQSQEALKLINGMPVEPGKVTHFNGMVNEMHTTAYSPKDDCESHWTYGEITELPARAERTTLGRPAAHRARGPGRGCHAGAGPGTDHPAGVPERSYGRGDPAALERGDLRGRALPNLRRAARIHADAHHHGRGEVPAPNPGKRGRAAPAHRESTKRCPVSVL